MHQPTLKALAIPSLIFAALAALVTASSPVGAETGTVTVAPAPQAVVPARTLQVILIKTTILTLNDANLSGNYTVLHARLSKPFREQITPERLAAVFKPFHDQQINLRSIITRRHTATVPPRLDGGVLKLDGYFEEGSNRLHYVLEFVREDNDWRPLRIEVYIKPIPEGESKANQAKKKPKRR